MPEGPENLAKSLFFIACIALFLMLILAGGIWGCYRWKSGKSHAMPNTQLIIPVNSSQSTVHS